ncbi:MAG: PepSY domain-containing protein [Methyloversatilis sp.]|uniref:PepSY domain-containing protein n=1 Tax=Methyloversatilis sp. TaxID=2569862 RepID=UPI0025CC33CA|nr:PepSY domain-containing protein [Methyloversatilis sp.]MCR6667472.1 PepSY domain-containing protein [Methyloversatilis sp.]
MNLKRIALFVLLPVTAVVSAAGIALLHAPDTLAGEDHLKARALSQRGDILPLEKIAERARAEKPGKLIDIELEQKKGIWVYEAEILDDAGRVWELKLDARTGILLEMEQDD